MSSPPPPPPTTMTTPIGRELCFLILQFLEDENLQETAHKLEKESGIFFNMNHFEELVMTGQWEEADSYLASFTKVDDNRYSTKVFFEIRKQNYLEALDRHDRAKAVEILIRDLKVFRSSNQDLLKEMAHLLTLDNFRENEHLANYGDTESARAITFSEIKKLVEVNPLLRDKLQFPHLKPARLHTLLNQSINCQHYQCKYPGSNPEIKTLYIDHSCEQSQQNGPQQLSIGWKLAAPSMPYVATPMPHVSLLGPSNSGHLKRPLSPQKGDATADYHSSDREYAVKRPRIVGPSNEITNVLPTTHLTVSHSAIARDQYSPDDLLPKSLAVTLDQGSMVMSMDFHPSQPTLLLVGTNIGDMILWDVTSKKRLAYKNFNVWDLPSCSQLFQDAFAKDSTIAVNRVAWNHDGSQFAVAYSKHLVHLYTFNDRENLVHHLEIDAHVGGVNDLAFPQPSRQVTVVTCGDDNLVKIWDTASGFIRFTFKSDTPVYSVCPYAKGNIEFIFSTSFDGKIKAWFYGNSEPKVDYTALDHSCTRMAYTDDGTRLFSCGTSKEGKTYLVEWDESEGSLKQTYDGLSSPSVEVVQFDTKNRLLAAGDEFLVKFWDMDKTSLLTTTDAEGGLPASPRLRFNKSGSLLAVSTSDNCIKILANVDGLRMLRFLEKRSSSATRPVSEDLTKVSTITPSVSVSSTTRTSVAIVERDAIVPYAAELKNDDTRSLVIIDPPIENSRPWKFPEVNEPSQCYSLRLPDTLLLVKVSRLLYMNSGTAILALASNGVHKLWRWQKTDKNITGKATTSLPPQLWKPSNAGHLTNDLNDINKEEAFHSFAISRNDSYIMSTSGGKISLFNMLAFKTMVTIMPPPPAATCIAFHPRDNNIVAIGMVDSSINIYDVRVDEVKTKLQGHHKIVSGLAFSSSLNVLVSAGLDAQLCIWAIDSWEKQASKLLQIPAGREIGPHAEICVQFHNDLIHFLVVHGSQLGIYEAENLECLEQWIPPKGIITNATYSCNGEMIYATFMDGSVRVFTTDLKPRCQINPTAYLSGQPSLDVYPLVVAAHPSEPNQFALGLSDGGVQVIEPLEAEGKWGATLPSES